MTVTDTRSQRPGTAFWTGCHRVARERGLAPALTELGAAAPAGALPCGPGGHAVVPAEHAATARLWLAGALVDGPVVRHDELASYDLPGGRVVALRCVTTTPAGRAETHDWAAWTLGLVWTRLGLSEGLRTRCLRYLRDRQTGDSVILRQQLVKGALADALAEQLEVRAALTGVAAGDLPAWALDELHDRITAIDREQLRLLGATSMLRSGPGEVAHVSELVAETYRAEESR